MSGGIGWLKPGSISGVDPQEAAEQRVEEAAKKLQDHLLPSAVAIFNENLFDTGLADEWLAPAERFVKLFRSEQLTLNPGVADLDFVRECVRRSFGIASIVPHGPEGQKRSWVTDEQIEKIALGLVELGYILPQK
jgi:hypothetical protein